MTQDDAQAVTDAHLAATTAVGADSPRAAPAGVVAELRQLSRLADFRKLVATRLVSQAGDGAFEIGLASLFFFSPERATTAGAIAAAFAAAVLPYTVIGPFVGVLLDRWRRRQILMLVNLARAVMVLVIAVLVAVGVVGLPLYLIVLTCLSVNRFYLSGLSAGLPHVVPGEELVLANAITPTAGTVAALLGGAAAVGVRLVLGAGDRTDAVILLAAAGCYAMAARLAARLHRDVLGPDAHQMAAWPGPRAAARGVVHDLREGVAHLWHHRRAFDALAMVGAQRFGYGVVTVTTILLCRNTFAAAADPDAGARRISTVAVATGLGLLTGALLTPAGHRRTTAKWWIVGCSTLAGVAVLGFSTSLTFPVVLVAGYLVGLAMQGSKICIDATVQGAVDDEARGRVMSLYDLTFNLAFLAAVTVCALLVPPSGLAAGVVVMVAAVFLAAAAAYSRSTGRSSSAATRGAEVG